MTDHWQETCSQVQKNLPKAHDLIRYWPTSPVQRDQKEHLHDGIWDAWDRVKSDIISKGITPERRMFSYQRYFGCSPDQVARAESLHQEIVQLRTENNPDSQKKLSDLLNAGTLHHSSLREQMQEQIADQNKEIKKIQKDIDTKKLLLQEKKKALADLSNEGALEKLNSERIEAVINEWQIKATKLDIEAANKLIRAFIFMQYKRHRMIRNLEETAELSQQFLQVYREWCQDLPDFGGGSNSNDLVIRNGHLDSASSIHHPDDVTHYPGFTSLRAEEVNNTFAEIGKIQEMTRKSIVRFGSLVSAPFQKCSDEAERIAERCLSSAFLEESIANLVALEKLLDEVKGRLAEQERQVAEQEKERKNFLKRRVEETVKLLGNATDTWLEESAQNYDHLPLKERLGILDRREEEMNVLSEKIATLYESGERLDLFLQGPSISKEARHLVQLNKQFIAFHGECEEYIALSRAYNIAKHVDFVLLLEASVQKHKREQEADQFLVQCWKEANDLYQQIEEKVVTLDEYKTERKGFYGSEASVADLYEKENNPYGLFNTTERELHLITQEDIKRMFSPIWKALKKVERLSKSSSRSEIQNANYLVGPHELSNVRENFSLVCSQLKEEFETYSAWVKQKRDALIKHPASETQVERNSPSIAEYSQEQEQFFEKTESLLEKTEECLNCAIQVKISKDLAEKINPGVTIPREIEDFCTSSPVNFFHPSHISLLERIYTFAKEISNGYEDIKTTLSQVVSAEERQRLLSELIANYINSFPNHSKRLDEKITLRPHRHDDPLMHFLEN